MKATQVTLRATLNPTTWMIPRQQRIPLKTFSWASRLVPTTTSFLFCFFPIPVLLSFIRQKKIKTFLFPSLFFFVLVSRPTFMTSRFCPNVALSTPKKEEKKCYNLKKFTKTKGR